MPTAFCFMILACRWAKSLQSGLTFLRPPWTATHQAPLSMGFCRQEYWSGVPHPSPRDCPHPGIELSSLISPAWAGGFFTTRSVMPKSQNLPVTTRELISAAEAREFLLPSSSWGSHRYQRSGYREEPRVWGYTAFIGNIQVKGDVQAERQLIGHLLL